MDTRAVALGLACVTLTAVDRLGSAVVVRMFFREVRVTTGAGAGLVRGDGQLAGIHKQGDFLHGGVRLRQGFVRVTLQTIAVGQTRQRRELQ